MSDAQIDALAQEMAAAGLIPSMNVPSEINLDDELEGLDEEIEIGTTGPQTLTDEDLTSLAAEIGIEETRQEVYAQQPAGADFVANKAVEATPREAPVDEVEVTPTATTRRARTPGTTPTPRSARFAAGGAGAYVASLLGDAEIATIVDGLPKKVKDKAANLVESVKSGKTLSVYTQTAVDLLSANGVLTNKALVEAFLAQAKRNGGSGYSIGTARSQAGQQISLLRGFGVIKADGTLDASNVFAQSMGFGG